MVWDRPRHTPVTGPIATWSPTSRRTCAELGFTGQLAHTEWTWWASYPGHPEWCTEMGKAKYSARRMTADAGMDVISLYNETFQNAHDIDVTLFRNAFPVDPIMPIQPQPIYYVLRSIATTLDGFSASEFSVVFSGDRELDCYTFAKSEDEVMFAVWIPGQDHRRHRGYGNRRDCYGLRGPACLG